MAVIIRKAERRKAKLRLALVGASNSGKTFSALQLAFGIGGKVGMIDTEHGSGELYADKGDYDVIPINPPYTVTKYRESLKAFEQAGYTTIIIDSLSHAWAGEGGLLEQQMALEKSGKYKNSYVSWGEITPQHNKLIEAILASPCHIIATMRAKTEYVLELNDRGKQVPRKMGLGPIQRDGVDFEFTVVMLLDDAHLAKATKDRTELFNDWNERISPVTGAMLLEWLESGVEPLPATPAISTITNDQAGEMNLLFRTHRELTQSNDLAEKMQHDYHFKRLGEIKQTDYDEIMTALRQSIDKIRETNGSALREPGED